MGIRSYDVSGIRKAPTLGDCRKVSDADPGSGTVDSAMIVRRITRPAMVRDCVIG